MKTNLRLFLASAMFLVAANNHAQPVLTRQPTNQSVSLGANVSFQISATTTNPPQRYQWRFVTTDHPSAANASLILTNIQVAQAGA